MKHRNENLSVEDALRMLGLEPGATKQQVDAAMAVIRETVTDRDRLREFQRYAFVAKSGKSRKLRSASPDQRHKALIAGCVLLIGLSVYGGLQLAQHVRPYMVSFEPGDALYRLDDGKPFGVIVAYEEKHAFSHGPPRAAYEIRLYPQDNRTWMTVDAVHNGLTSQP